MTVKFILLVNKQGQTRLAKYTDVGMAVEERRVLEGEIVRKCLARSEKQARLISLLQDRPQVPCALTWTFLWQEPSKPSFAVPGVDLTALCARSARSSSTATTRWCTGDMRPCSSWLVWTQRRCFLLFHSFASLMLEPCYNSADSCRSPASTSLGPCFLA